MMVDYYLQQIMFDDILEEFLTAPQTLDRTTLATKSSQFYSNSKSSMRNNIFEKPY